MSDNGVETMLNGQIPEFNRHIFGTANDNNHDESEEISINGGENDTWR